MDAKVTITREQYDQLRHQAAAWRRAIGTDADSVIFNAVRDNDGEGVEAGVLAEKLRVLIEE